MIEFILGFLTTVISFSLGFSFGRFDKPLPPKVQEQITEIFKKKIPIIPDSQVGAVSRPSQDQLDHFKNPKLVEEEQIMQEELDRLNKK